MTPRARAEAAVGRWQLSAPVHIEPLVDGENSTSRVTTPVGRFLLRCARPDRHPAIHLRAECTWLEALTAAGFKVPCPVRGRDGAWIQVVDDRSCLLFRWVAGDMRSRDRTAADLRAIGRLAGRLHTFAADWRPPTGFARPTLNTAALVGARSRFGPADMWVEGAHRTRIAAVRQTVEGQLTAAGLSTCTLIHGDLYRGNVVFDGGNAHAIDFDDLAFGPPAFDLAVALDGIEAQPALVAGLLEGYASTAELTPRTRALLAPLLLARKLRLVAWAHARADTNPQIGALRTVFIDRCLTAFDAYVGGRVLASV